MKGCNFHETFRDGCSKCAEAQPAPAPLPVEVESVRIFRQRIESFHTHDDSRITIRLGDGRTLLTHIATQARRLAEVEADIVEWKDASNELDDLYQASKNKLKRVSDFCASRCICHKAGPDCPKGRFSWPPPWAAAGPCDEWEEPEGWNS